MASRFFWVDDELAFARLFESKSSKKQEPAALCTLAGQLYSCTRTYPLLNRLLSRINAYFL